MCCIGAFAHYNPLMFAVNSLCLARLLSTRCPTQQFSTRTPALTQIIYSCWLNGAKDSEGSERTQKMLSLGVSALCHLPLSSAPKPLQEMFPNLLMAGVGFLAQELKEEGAIPAPLFARLPVFRVGHCTIAPLLHCWQRRIA